jgi:peptidoglycan/LPS O-acetylase OafA/YrhL
MGLVRLWLALCVSTAHIQVFTFPDFAGAEHLFFNLGGNRAVILFFTVSGFLMSFVLDRKYSGRGGTLEFYRARFLRIYPLWWAMIAITLVVFGLEPLRKPIVDLALDLGLIGLDWRIALTTFPEPYAALFAPLGIGWSLAPEIAFYLIAPFVLRSLALSAGIFAASLVVRLAILHDVLYGPKWLCLAYYWFPSVAMFFLLGHFARLIWKHLPVDRRLGLLLIPAAIACIEQAPIGYFDSPWFYASLLFFALALPPVFDLTKDSRLMASAGDLTYPLYLTHVAVLHPALLWIPSFVPRLRETFAALPFSPFGQFAAVALVGNVVFLIAAFAAHRLIDRPLRRAMGVVLSSRWRRTHADAATPAQ